MTERNTNNNANATNPFAIDINALQNRAIFGCYKRKEVIESNSARDIAAAAIRESIFAVIIANTACHRDIDEEEFSYLRDKFAVYCTATKVTISAKGHESSYHFNGMFNKPEVLAKLLNEIIRNSIWYEDKVEHGFCCPNNRGEHTYITFELPFKEVNN